jgi:hypothetical protein|tara:strand:+ start:20242 stop:21018 length:777 start_codon:yes stop_codon:yes gene_type:complete
MSATKTTKKKAAKKFYGPDAYKRNEHGLLENVDYEFNEDGTVNWRAMIKPEFLYPNKGWFDVRNKPLPTSTEDLDDKQLLIMLGGIKELAKMRGYSTVAFDVTQSSDGYVTAKCIISWNKNYETQDEVVYQDYANATLANTDSFCAKFLETIACNRAFVRCVRNYLNIHIVGADEIDKSQGAGQAVEADAIAIPITPVDLLAKTLRDKHGVDSFDSCKDVLRDLWKSEKYRNEEAKKWSSFSDIPAREARKLIVALNK